MKSRSSSGKKKAKPYTAKHNTGAFAKVELRRRVLAQLGSSPRVLETHAGYGDMRRACYQDAAHWLGCDQDPKTPGPVIHCDSRLLLRAIDLSGVNLLDCDPYGMPFEHLWIFSRRWRGQRLGLALTCGGLAGVHQMKPDFRTAGFSRQMLDALGVAPTAPFRGLFTEERVSQVTLAFLGAWFPGMKVEHFWSANNCGKGKATGVSCWYLGAVLQARKAL